METKVTSTKCLTVYHKFFKISAFISSMNLSANPMKEALVVIL